MVSGVAPGTGRTVFVFPGQGAQWVGMGVGLLDSSPVFAERVGECAVALEPFTGWNLVDVLRGVEGVPGLDRVDVVQPALWAVMVSLARLWEHLGVVADAVVGHSQGEIAAAHIAGVLSLEDAARVVALRSRTIAAMAGPGGMVSVPLPMAEVSVLVERWHGRVFVAAVNGPSATVVAGDGDALAELLAHCEGAEIRARRVPVDYASHTPHMEALRDQLLDLLAPVRPQPASVAFYSSVAGYAGGSMPDTSVMGAAYWYENLATTVDFRSATRALLDDGHSLFIEASPHPVLTHPVLETAEESAGTADVTVTGTLRREDDTWQRILTSLATTHIHRSADWSVFYPAIRPVDLPTYPFQHQRYWLLDHNAPGGGRATGGTAVVAAAAVADPVEAEFWDAVEREDPAALIRTLGLGDAGGPNDAVGSALPAVLSAMSSWRRRRTERSVQNTWRYRATWKPLPGIGIGIGTGPAPRLDGGDWLVVVPATVAQDPVAETVIEALRRRRTRVVRCEVAPAELRDRTALGLRLSAVLADEEAPVPFTGVLSLAALVDDGLAAAHQPVSGGLAGTVALVQALEDTGVEARLWCLTGEAVATGHADTVRNPLQAQIWGLGRAVALERPERWGGLVDVPARLDDRTADLLCAVLVPGGGADGAKHGDGADGGHGEDEIAVRASGVYGRRLTRAPLDDAPDQEWRPSGTVLVTGGAGAVGSHICRWLARAGAPHLLLVGRRGTDTPGIGELTAELTELGSRVTVAAVDAADRDALRTVLASIPAEYPLRAVIHGAAVLADGLVESLTPERLARVLRPKVAAAVALHELTADRDLDAFVLFSSAAGGVWGSGGQGGYAAANAFADALAETRRAAGLKATAVAWGSWGGGGLVTGGTEERLRGRGLPPMEPAAATAALAASLGRDETRIMVARVEWADFAPVLTAARPSRLIADLPDIAPPPAAATSDGPGDGVPDGELAARLRKLPDSKLDEALLAAVQGHSAAVLGLAGPATIRGDRAFSLAGFDSLTAMEMRNRLRRATGLPLSTTLLFDHPTPVAVARHLREELFPERTARADAETPGPNGPNGPNGTDNADGPDGPDGPDAPDGGREAPDGAWLDEVGVAGRVRMAMRN
ncbi:SDR family NAD(P)-dependent oxidoreductase, partial [Streptomyces sp. NPDC058953]|uniref:SDR family NAD(P)-dependent oxidoreductase n=1 Tax=Streptomyces sp. NPDC058953 TaxID=3346676 RepID=UPI00369D7921